MSSGQNKIFDDFARLMTDAAGAAQGMKREAETILQAQAERFISSMDLVQREEHEAVKEMAAKARDENEKLESVIAKLEARVEKLESKK